MFTDYPVMFQFFRNVLTPLLIGIVPTTVSWTRTSTALAGMLPEEEMTPDQLEIKKISEKWADVRHLSREDAEAQLDAEWLEAYNRFYDKYGQDMQKMDDILTIVKKQIEPERVQKKSKGQKKRDKWAKVQARETARADA